MCIASQARVAVLEYRMFTQNIPRGSPGSRQTVRIITTLPTHCAGISKWGIGMCRKTGECEVRGDDLGGLAVHVAARIGSLARPSEVLVSSTVKDLVTGSGDRVR
jgi:hypothetical protein